MFSDVDDLIAALPFEYNGYTFQSLIGSGRFACVVKAVQNSKGHEFAAKIIHCSDKENKKLEAVKSEIDCMMQLLHPSIIKIYDKFRRGNFLFLILELCYGTIDSLVKSEKKLSERQILQIMKQLLSAIKYCHSKGIAHRDIKPANILLSKNGLVKLGDFGISINVKEEETIKSSQGTLVFKAPELILNQEHCPFKSDIWSLGVTFYYIATGTYPWGYTLDDIRENILLNNFSFPDDTPASVVDIISRMCVTDPIMRATPEELLLDPVFRSIRVKPLQTVSKNQSTDETTTDDDDEEKRIPLCCRIHTLPYKTKSCRTILSSSGMLILTGKTKKSKQKNRNFKSNPMLC